VQLARHFEKAGIQNKACHYLHRAGEQSAANYAHAEAVEFFSRALDLLSADMVEEREALLLAREKAYDLLGQREAQEDDLTSLRALANAQDDDQLRTEVYLRLAHFRGVTGKLDNAVEAARSAIELAQAIQDVSREAAGYLAWGRALQHQASYEQAQRQLEKALALTRSRLSQIQTSQMSIEGVEWATLRLLEADSLRGLAHVFEERGKPDEAGPFLQQARGLYRELGHRRGECRVLNSLANLRKEQGDYETALTLHRQALALAREIGDRHAEGGVLSNLGTVHDNTGDFPGARKYHEQALMVRREIEDLRGQAISLGNLGVIAGRQNDHTAARQRFEEALALFREIGDQWGTGLTLRNLASVCLYLGDYESASAYTIEARGIFQAIDYPRGVAGAESMLGLLLSLQGSFEESVAHCQRALDILDVIGELGQQPQTLSHLGDALLGLNDLDSAAEAYTQAIELLRGSGAEHKMVEPLAGMARIALAEGDSARALAHIEQLLPHLTTMDDPYYAYLTCYQVFRANDDTRANEFLSTAHRLLQKNAALLSDETSRRSFLESVRVNREIVEEFARLHLDG
jgi:tetratricopeptide (TPR) repeat protein